MLDETTLPKAHEATIWRARPGTIARFVVGHLILTIVVNLILFASGVFRPLAEATGGWFTGSLLVNLIGIFFLIMVIIARYGDLRGSDIGWTDRHLPIGIGLTALFWGAAQLIHLIAGWLQNGVIRLHPAWDDPGAVVGALLTQIFGVALFEEIAYRGFLFPQLYLRREGSPWARMIWALVVSQAIFALSHLPNRLYRGLTLGEIALDLPMLMGWGIFYALIYLRTDNLFLAVGAHALGNAPTTWFATTPALDGAGASYLMYALIALALFGVPLMRAARGMVTRNDAWDQITEDEEQADGETAQPTEKHAERRDRRGLAV